MKLYTERHGIRAPLKKTYIINEVMYLLLLNCCEKYKKNLTHMFILNCYDDFTNSDYISFDERMFNAKIKIRIPFLYRDEYDMICTPQYGSEYNQYALLDLIEYFAQNIKDIYEHWNNEKYRNYKTINCLETSEIFINFQKEINDIFLESGLLYELTDKKIIERIVENSLLTTEIENSFETIKEKGTRDLLKDAVALYKTPNVAARQDSVEKMWDALERLKTYYTELDKKKSIEKIVNDMAGGDANFLDLFDKEFKTLTDIGNLYRIRHHETNKIDIVDIKYYDYFFNRCLSLIAIAIQYLK
mgnify:CR=1 FL=1